MEEQINYDDYGQPEQSGGIVSQTPGESVQVPEKSQQTPIQTAPEFDPKSWELKYQGKPFFPKDRQHLVNLAQQGFGYSQNQEQLKKQMQEIESMRGQYSQYAELDKRFKENPELAHRIIQSLTQEQQGEQGQGQINPEMLQVRQALEEINGFKKEWLDRQADDRLKNELNELKSKYPNYDWENDDGEGTLSQKILKHAYENKMFTIGLDKAFRDYMFDNAVTQSKTEALKQAQMKRAQDMEAGKVAGGGRTVKPQAPVGYNPSDSYDDLAGKAIKDLGG